MPDPTNPNAPGAGVQGGDAPQFVTAEQVAEIVNKAITGRNKAFEANITKTFAETISGLNTSIAEQIAALAPKPKEDAPKAAGDSPELLGMRKQLAEVQNLMKASQEREAAAIAKARDQQMRGQVGEALVKMGIDPKRAPIALGHLIDATKRVALDEDGTTLVFRGSDGAVDFETGIRSWAKSEEAQIFLPPRGAQGSGARGGGSAPAHSNGAITHADIGMGLVGLMQSGKGQF